MIVDASLITDGRGKLAPDAVQGQLGKRNIDCSKCLLYLGQYY
ncbi:hypothetical protein AVDCRST_MAG92-3251 [uncultured Coleofasciculus sp.]|uniref:Uncharacterized protein n=1 Tax=uncultured Coleofasciculus sp. TaxID=1267456 RepID=A0A6J4JCT1_9CYAN|nr:hypothetical protein AVDCRST_MAG92-3251 [uncultured Coleofasciculus sp.]